MKRERKRNGRSNEATALRDLAAGIDRDLQAVRQALRKPVESAYAEGNLTGPQRSVMRVVFHSDGIGLKELSQKIGLAHSTVSGIVDRLEKRGMLARQQDEVDGRAVKIVVSTEVRAFMRNKVPELTLHPLVDALSKLTPADRRKVARGVEALRMALED